MEGVDYIKNFLIYIQHTLVSLTLRSANLSPVSHSSHFFEGIDMSKVSGGEERSDDRILLQHTN